MNRMSQTLNWQKVKAFLHLFNFIDHLFALVILAVLIPLRWYWKRFRDTDCQSLPQADMAVSLIYDSIRISTGRVDAAYDYIIKLDQSLNQAPQVISRIRLMPEDAGPHNATVAWKLKNALARAREIAETDSRLVHIHYTVGAYKSGLAIYLIPFLIRFFKPRPRVVITYHQFTEHKPSSFLFRSLFLLLCLSVDGYIFLRTDHIRSFVWWETFLNKNFTFIPSPSNLEFANRKSGEVRSPSGHFPAPSSSHSAVNLSHFGTIRQGKGLETLIKAFGIVHEKNPDLKLILAGAIDRAYHEKLKKRISVSNLTNSISFTGPLDPDKLSDTLLGTIIVLPFPDGASTYRSSLMAALSMGLPIITTRSKNTPEMFEDEKNIFLAKCGSCEDLAAVIEKALSYHADYRERIGREGQALYNQVFAWPNCRVKHLAFYRKIL